MPSLADPSPALAPGVALLWVALGGAIGAVARWLLAGWAQRIVGGAFPFGTLFVNVLGCFLIGALMHLVDRGALGESVRLFAVVGLLGALTTFSTFGHETLALLRRDEMLLALASVAANVVVGLGAVILGLFVGRALY